MRARFLSSLILIFAAVLQGPAWAAAADDRAPELRRALQTPASAAGVAGEPVRAFKTVRRFFAQRQYLPIWSEGGREDALEALLGAISASVEHGLSPADYHLDTLKAARARADRPAVELLATDAFLLLGAHLLGGKVDPVSIEPDWTAGERGRDLAAHLATVLETGRVSEGLAELAPAAPEYRVLKSALAMYRQVAAEGEWPRIPGGPTLGPGSRGARVAALRHRLEAGGLIEPGDGEADVYDTALESAVARFQLRIGLEADGSVGPLTLTELNRSVAYRVDQLRANLERWRWLPDDLGRRHIRVNIADFRLEARSGGRVERVHEVVVGRTYRKTPVFSDQISYVVLNPWWETPARLARLDKLPLFRKDPGAVGRLGFQVLDPSGRLLEPAGINWRDYSAGDFPFRLRQRPGPQNALGQVKIMFPNKHNVYLHDTPQRDLFDRNQRAFSSGCVRVRDALGLAEWVLSGRPESNRQRIDEVLASGRETRWDLADRVSVHLLYFTAVADTDGEFRLLSDVYDRDARLIEALAH